MNEPELPAAGAGLASTTQQAQIVPTPPVAVIPKKKGVSKLVLFMGLIIIILAGVLVYVMINSYSTRTANLDSAKSGNSLDVNNQNVSSYPLDTFTAYESSVYNFGFKYPTGINGPEIVVSDVSSDCELVKWTLPMSIPATGPVTNFYIQTSSGNYFCSYTNGVDHNVFGIGNAQEATTLETHQLKTKDGVAVTEVIQQFYDRYRLVAYTGNQIPETLPSGSGSATGSIPDVIGWYAYSANLDDIQNSRSIIENIITSTTGNLKRKVPLPTPTPAPTPEPVVPTGTQITYPGALSLYYPDDVTAEVNDGMHCLDFSFPGYMGYAQIGPGSCKPSGFGASTFSDYTFNVGGTSIQGKKVTGDCGEHTPYNTFFFTMDKPSGGTISGQLEVKCQDEVNLLPLFTQMLSTVVLQ